MLRSTSRTRSHIVIAAFALPLAAGLTACNSDVSNPDESSQIASALSTSPAGFSELTSSYAAGEGGDSMWAPPGRRGGPGGHGGPGFGGRDGGAGFMGGGLDPAFFGAEREVGGRGPGRGHERERFASGIDGTCTFAAATGDLTCGPTTRNGLTTTRIYTFRTSAGVAQQRPDSTTNSERLRVTVSGTTTRRGRGDSVTATVQHASDRTVTGLASTSAQRTVNGVSAGTENSSGRNRESVAFTSRRVSGDTTVGLVIPRATTANPRPFPTAGTVTRSMSVTMTLQGQAATTTTRREVITYDGSSTAKVTVTQNGTTRNCTMPLPRGRLTCA